MLKKEHQLSERKGCRALNISRSSYQYRPDPNRDDEVIEALQGMAERYPRYGFRKLFIKLRKLGHPWNHKRVYRIYCFLKLNLRRKGKQRLPNRYPQPLAVPDVQNRSWSMDFMSDALKSGKRFRTFNVVDDFNREVLGIEIDLSMPTNRVIQTLDRIAEWRGYPEQIRMDNGPEFTAVALSEWADIRSVKLEFIKPGKPTQNGYVERFNRTYRTEVLDYYLFSDLNEVREITHRWMMEYNDERPHESLGDLTPTEYRERKANLEIL